MDYRYLIFGLEACSNFPLPGLNARSAESDAVDVYLRFGASPDISEAESGDRLEPFYTSSFRSESGEPVLRARKISGGRLLRFDYADHTRFWIDASGREVWARWTETSSFEDAASYLLPAIFGYLLRLRGITCLHASAIACGSGAMGFVGPGGAGKSTSAAALAQRGHAVISDDVVAIHQRDGAFYAVPAYPYVALWPDSIQALYEGNPDYPAFSANFSKRMLPLESDHLRFAEQPAPLDLLFLLDERSSASAAPGAEPLGKREALLALVANTYANLLLDEQMRAREFALLGQLVNAVPVLRLRAHQDASRLGALCELIEREFAARKSIAVSAPH